MAASPSGPATMTVPFLSRTDAEPFRLETLCFDGRRLRYSDEVPEDRDRVGVLWARQHDARGEGRPRFGFLHSPRQRLATTTLRCQVCAGDPDEADGGLLWLLPESRDAVAGRSALCTPFPPVCAPCCHTALRHCPALRDHTLVRAGRVTLHSVSGDVYDPETGTLDGDDTIKYTDPRLPRVLAYRQNLRIADLTLLPDPPPP